MFQHTATRRWLRRKSPILCSFGQFQHTATRRWLLCSIFLFLILFFCFNTQPPEGGCPTIRITKWCNKCFNTQPPEGGCFIGSHKDSRWAGFNTQPPEGGCNLLCIHVELIYCFNTQPPEGGCLQY